MILIGESINIVSKKIGGAIREKDPRPIQEMALAQEEAGADMLDINIGPARKAPEEMMSWVVKAVEEVTSLPLSLDTTNPIAMEAGLKTIKKGRPIINSASAQTERLETILPLAKKYDVPVIGLLLTNEGMPRDVEERVNITLKIVEKANELGIENEDLWIDPLLFSVTVDQQQVVNFVEFLSLLPDLIVPQVGSTCGLSNVSNGAPKELRSILNRTMYCILHPLGIHSAIVDVLDKELMRTVRGIEEKGGVEGFLASIADEERRDMEKTIKVLRNESIYCDSWLEL
jgi:5-methyltetrahydrofolate corrinoid/iron sulfur protein methyltransferase